MDNKNTQLAFASIDKYVESSIPSIEEIDAKNGKLYCEWGENNSLPNYYDELFRTTELRGIIMTTADFVSGDDVICNVPRFSVEVNKRHDTAFELVNDLAKDYLLFGNCYVQVIKDKANQVAEIYRINPQYIRTDKKSSVFVYSKDWGKKYARSSQTLTYQRFMPDSNVPTSIAVIKTENDKAYGLPRWISALKECEVSRQLSELTLSQIENGFFPSFIISFNNGIPSDTEKLAIEEDIQEKFVGSSNCGRVLINFSNGKDNSVELQKLDVENYAEKFRLTQETARNAIYEACSISPVLMGINMQTGWNDQDYQQSFKLYNRLVVKPLQKKIAIMLSKIMGVENAIEIKPYTIDWSEDGDDNQAITD